ncbi:25266_t:CDS:2, partial [Gigaspora margarita]
MLIWELCYETIPYKTLETKKVADYVLSGKREKLISGKFDDTNDVNIQKKFNEIINKGNRIDLMQLHRKLEKLAEHNPIALCAPQLLENNKLDFGITCDTENSKLPKFEDEPINFYENISSIDPLISVDEGIEFHRNKNYESAWKSVADAQYRYAVSLIGNDPNINDEKCNKILHYLKLAIIQSLDGTLTQQPKGTIGVVVVPDNSDFTFRCKERSKILVYPIILTKQSNICSDLELIKKFPTPEEKNFWNPNFEMGKSR